MQPWGPSAFEVWDSFFWKVGIWVLFVAFFLPCRLPPPPQISLFPLEFFFLQRFDCY